LLLAVFLLAKRGSVNNPEALSLYFPFVFSEAVDPRNIFTVGDQVLSEHLFGFNARLATKAGFGDFVSEVRFSPASSEVTVKPKYNLRRGDGSDLHFNQFCEGLESSLRGTQHAPYGKILEGLRCDEVTREVVIKFSTIPVNLRFLFTVPDFSVFDPNDLPISARNGTRTTGPYTLESLNQDHASLKRNPFYPPELVSNRIDKVDIYRYTANDTTELIELMSPATHHAVYFFGYSVTNEDLGKLKAKGYTVSVSPTEWFVYLSLKQTVSAAVRAALATAVERFKVSSEFHSSLGVAATSIAPSDREYALSADDLRKIHTAHFARSSSQGLPAIKIATLETWAGIPFFAKAISFLKNEIPNIEVELLPPGQIGKLFSADIPIALCPLGISPTDPLTHFSFLTNTLAGFKNVVSAEEISAAATLSDMTEFNRRMKDFERRTVESGFLLPIAHFPGVVAMRSDFKINDSQSFGWGIQAWSMHRD
jgi:hypothetical protein